MAGSAVETPTERRTLKLMFCVLTVYQRQLVAPSSMTARSGSLSLPNSWRSKVYFSIKPAGWLRRSSVQKSASLDIFFDAFGIMTFVLFACFLSSRGLNVSNAACSQSRRERRFAILLSVLVATYLTIVGVARAGTPKKNAVESAVRSDSNNVSDSKVQKGLTWLKQGTPADLKQAYRLFEEAAENNNPDAEFNLGILYMNGQGVPKSDKEAAFWFRKAAEKGHVIAQFNLAQIMHSGDGIEHDLKESAKWFGEAAKNGHVIAAYNLGVMYWHGRGVSKDYAKAVTYYQSAADRGHADAQSNLGLMYLDGEGVNRDVNRAINLLSSAAKSGNPSSTYTLGQIYRSGNGVPVNYELSAKYFGEGAKKNHTPSMAQLALMYGRGQGVEKNSLKMIALLQQAASLGDKSAAEVLRKIERK